MPPPELDAVGARLLECREPYLIGVRHHSPACAHAVPRLLDALAPAKLLLELPPELASWLPWLGRQDLEAPVALAGVRVDDGELAFYPFADFSPELAAVRWAAAHDVPVEAIDLPFGARTRVAPGQVPAGPSWVDAACRRIGAEDSEALWDQLVEARAHGSSPEQLRRAALLVGYALRQDAAERGGVSSEDLARETHMRRRVERATAQGDRCAAVVGAFHAAALLPDPLLFEARTLPDVEAKLVTALVPYAFELLDSRSGYPAGIRDPRWHQQLWEASAEDRSPAEVACEALTELCRDIRDDGHVAGVPDASEALRMASDLAHLRQLPAPGRREVLEAIQSALAQGELHGRGRVLARALERTFVGRRRGRLPAGVPRSGLAPHVESLLAALRLPGPQAMHEDAKLLRLDPLRSALDRRREVALARLAACAVPYGERSQVDAAGAAEALTTRWEVRWLPSTGAMLELAAMRGVTLAQATQGALRAEAKRQQDEEQWDAGAQLAALVAAAHCGLPALVDERLSEVGSTFVEQAGLAELVGASEVLARMAHGHFPGLPRSEENIVSGEIEAWSTPLDGTREHLLGAAVRALEGMTGSEREEDARALLELSRLRATESLALGEGRLAVGLKELVKAGSPLMQGACAAAQALLGHRTPQALGEQLAGWTNAAVDRDAKRALGERVAGAMIVSGPLMEADPSFAAPWVDVIEGFSDEGFLNRLPALRHGFERLSPAARQRLLDSLTPRLPGRAPLDVQLDVDPGTLGRWAEADRAALAGLEAFDPALTSAAKAPLDAPPAQTEATVASRDAESHALSSEDRWRLILGRERQRLSAAARRPAAALEELYGHGRGEGSRQQAGPGGGREDGFPSAREWGEELEALFGQSVREEVLSLAAESRPAALLELAPEQVQPSVELLEQVLSLSGGLSEGQLTHLRRLVDAIVQGLVEQLAKRVRPALTGVNTPHPTLRPTGRLDLRRTLRRNLRTARRGDDGAITWTPEQLVFRQRGRRAMDWHVVLVVDVSGSMEASVIYSALMAAIFHGLPALSAKFFAFNTRVIDLSDRVEDPLGLLLEVNVGGGTHIAHALRYAREQLVVPSRSLVVTVSDFEEGYPVDALAAEVRALVETGAHCLGVAALDDRGAPRYSRAIAERVVACGMPVAALTPLELARWVGEKIR